MRAQDAMPDELEVIPEGAVMGGQSSAPAQTGTPIPKTVVETVEPIAPSHGNVPGHASHSNHRADAVPNVIVQASKHEQDSTSQPTTSGSSDERLIPKTVVTKVNEEPSHGEVPSTEAHEIRKADPEPDVVEKKGDAPGKSISSPTTVQRTIDRIRFTNVFFE